MEQTHIGGVLWLLAKKVVPWIVARTPKPQSCFVNCQVAILLLDSSAPSSVILWLF